jgi:surface antigen
VKHKIIISTVLLVLFLTGCTADGPKESAGTFIGAATGALVGSQFGKGNGQLAGVAIGTLLGAQLGAHVGAKMDHRDKELANQAAYRTLEKQPDNVVSSWKNPNTNHRGNFVVTNTTEKSNRVCRSYTNTVFIEGKQEVLKGQACRQDDGTWRHDS